MGDRPGEEMPDKTKKKKGFWRRVRKWCARGVVAVTFVGYYIMLGAATAMFIHTVFGPVVLIIILLTCFAAPAAAVMGEGGGGGDGASCCCGDGKSSSPVRKFLGHVIWPNWQELYRILKGGKKKPKKK